MKPKNRRKDSHKGQNGRILLVGGSKEYVGAAALAGLAGLRCGADTVVICAPEKVAWAINCLSPDLITRKFKGEYFKTSHAKEIIAMCKKFDVLLIGNGIGKKSNAFVRKIVRSPMPKVIDADALKAIRIQDVKNAVLTPHAKEFEILLKNSRRSKDNFRKALGSSIILLKGPIDRIISQSRIKLNRTGNPGMTKGGTGDVLAGLVAGFISQGYGLFAASYQAAFYNCRIADLLLKRKKGFAYLASDMVNDIKKVLRQRKVYMPKGV